jgi:hypothetical protein
VGKHLKARAGIREIDGDPGDAAGRLNETK